ncbi:O-mannosyl-transferase [Acrasis kona]|uniref:O-mannosyl-transferase n=1 Tax=Acrasis kona TaxID=1008807 RepID=A0AAW2ZJD0_9EUKA
MGLISNIIKALTPDAILYGSTINLASIHLKTITAEPHGEIVADRFEKREWETFTIAGGPIGTTVQYGSGIQLVSHHGTLITATPDGAVVGNREAAAEWETFRILPGHGSVNTEGGIHSADRISLFSHHGTYICHEEHKKNLVCDRRECGPWETFTIFSNTKYIPNLSASAARSMPPNVLHYNDFIKIKHITTNSLLRSTNQHYHSGSKQQIVYCGNENDDGDYWRVVNPFNKDQSGPVPLGQVITIEHFVTKHKLHSHNHDVSPATNQQEVTGYDQSDANDHWVFIDPMFPGQNGNVVFAGQNIHLFHQPTGKILKSDLNTFGLKSLFSTTYYQEVVATPTHDHKNLFLISEIRQRFWQ